MKDECIKRMVRPGKADFTVTAARLVGAGEKNGEVWLIIAWETESAGFGELSISQDGEALEADTERMGRRFVGEVFAKLVSNMEID